MMVSQLYFDKNLLDRDFIIDPVKEFNFTYESLFTNATAFIEGELNHLKPGQKALLISSDVYQIFCFVLACWINKTIPAIISPNLKIEDYVCSFFENAVWFPEFVCVQRFAVLES